MAMRNLGYLTNNIINKLVQNGPYKSILSLLNISILIQPIKKTIMLKFLIAKRNMLKYIMGKVGS